MRLINDEGKGLECRKIRSEHLGMLSEERLEMLKLLAQKPAYPAELARIMKMPIQRVYYHVRLLEKTGLMEFVEYEKRNGGVAKRYSCNASSLAIVLKESAWKEVTAKAQRAVPKFLAPFVKSGFFDGLMIVGSPDPHGKYRARASELGMLEFTMALGQYATFGLPFYKLDTQVKAEDRMKNLILAGGPKVNTIVSEINSKLPIRFDDQHSELHSSISGKRYSGNIGVIELILNPYAKGSSILLVGGLNQAGTRAAVIAMITKMSELETGNKNNPKIRASVIEGYDEDGDGVVDAVEIRE